MEATAKSARLRAAPSHAYMAIHTLPRPPPPPRPASTAPLPYCSSHSVYLALWSISVQLMTCGNGLEGLGRRSAALRVTPSQQAGGLGRFAVHRKGQRS